MRVGLGPCGGRAASEGDSKGFIAIAVDRNFRGEAATTAKHCQDTRHKG